jgi:signal transduction histidine kinase
MPGGSVCLQVFASGETDEGGHLEIFDGSRRLPLPFPEPSISGFVTAIYPAQNGDFWLATEHSVQCRHGGEWRRFASSDRTTPEGATALIEKSDGKIWCAALDRIWEFDGRGWSVVRAGLDRINGLVRARDGSVWVATSSGAWHESQGGWIENGLEEGLPDEAIHDVYQDAAGGIWAATGRGLSRYYPAADTDPPRTRVRRLADRNDRLLEGDSLNLLFHGEDKWRFTPDDRLFFSYRLDQQDWSPFQELNAVSFSRLAAGKHYFQVRAQDRNGNIDPTPALLDFDVALPWYEEVRLLVISSLAVAAASVFAALALNRHRQLQRSYAAVEKKIAERTRELEVANNELLHSQKMNALGTLAAGVAHDFNNILSIIKGSAQIIEGNLENPAKIRTRVDRIKTVVEQGAGIVQAMLGFSRASDLPPSPCDLNAVVSDTIRLLGDRFLREVQVVFEPAADLPPVTVPRDLAQQIVLNFIFNAAESMTGRRRVRLSTALLGQPPTKVVLAPGNADAWVSISVQDSGSGIPPEILSRIFEPFFTTKAMSTRRGTGLGLSMAYELAKKMSAGIAVESQVDHGSTFTLILPVQSPAAAPPARQAHSSETVAGQPR